MMKILCDTHSHTVASTHAYSTVHDYVRDAKACGLQLFSITDHSHSMPDAPHMWHFGNMKIIPRILEDVVMLRGIETNILAAPYSGAENRYVDLPDGLVPFLDFAIASFHEQVIPPGNIADNTRAAIRAIESGVIQILGHPGNPRYPINQSEVIRAAKDNNVLLEVNNSSLVHSRTGSEPYCTALIELVDTLDWKISLGSDAHISFQVGKFEAAISILEKVNFPEHRIVTKTPERFLTFLEEHGKTVKSELTDWLQSKA